MVGSGADDPENGTRLVDRILDDQHPRGPDHRARIVIEHGDAQLVLGHNRLSIIDLQPQSHQPMWDLARRHCIVFNGMIYNYVELRKELAAEGAAFQTASDTEVILGAYAAWGARAFERLEGMFAAALYDSARGEVVLFRDRFGVKPLYYHRSARRLSFASTSRVIAGYLGLRPSLEYVVRGLDHGVFETDSELTAYEGLAMLAPGTSLAFQLSDARCSTRRFYDFAAGVAHAQERLRDIPGRELVDTVWDELKRAVVKRLRADVPVGISLSGGLDSSAIAGVAARAQSGLRAFTWGTADDGHSEFALARVVAEASGMELQQVTADPARSAGLLHEALAAQDAPFTTLSVLAQYRIFESVKASGTRVLLGGQGADEAFLGYRKFALFHARALWHAGQYPQFTHFVASWVPSALAELPRWHTYWHALRRYRGIGPRARLLAHEPVAPLEPGFDPARTSLTGRQIADVLRFSLPTLLRYEDRNSMAHGVESRLPFLDHRLFELAVALPEHLKLRHGYGKWALREAARGLVPHAIRAARVKRGFDVDTPRWLAAGVGNALRAILHERHGPLQALCTRPLRIDTDYSDVAMAREPLRLTEALSLAWLGAKV